MITRQLAQNLVAIGMADFIKRSFHVAMECGSDSRPHDDICCQESSVDTLASIVSIFGVDIYKDWQYPE